MAQPTLEMLLEGDDFLFGKLDNLAILIWRRTPNVATVQRVVDAFPRFVSPGGFGLLAVVGPQCAPPDSELRRVMNDAMRAYRDSLLGIATVVQTQGIFGGLSRAISRTLSVVSRTPYPHNVYATIEEASRWLPSLLSPQPTPKLSSSMIVDAIAEVYPAARSR